MKKIPFLYRMIRGAVGKRFVVKHYKGGKVVVTRFPDMSGIVASGKQRERRDLFREAVVYAKWIVGDEERKKAFRKTLPWKKRKHVYQAAIRLYIRMAGDKQWLRKQLAVKAVVRSVSGMVMNVREVRGETANGRGFQEQRGCWRVLWQKRQKVEELISGDVIKDGLVVLRI